VGTTTAPLPVLASVTFSYARTYAYDLLAQSERITASSCDAAMDAHRDGRFLEGHVPELIHVVRID